ncbi:MAG: hypothetical protein ABJH05_07610 [Fulvivirga sp.]
MKYPPLKVWLITFIFITGVMTALYQYRKEVDHFFFTKPIEVAFQKATIDPGDIKVVLLLSSHGHRALGDPERLEKLMFEKYGAKFSFIKVFKQRAEFEDFANNEYLIKQINDLAPDYVILQEGHIFFRKPKKNLQNRTLHLFGLKDIHLITYLKGLAFGFENYYDYDQNIDSIKDSRIGDSTLIRKWVTDHKKIKAKNYAWKKFSKSIKGKKIITSIPLPNELEQKMNKKRNAKKFKKLIAKTRSFGQFKFFIDEHDLPYRMYLDVRHMNLEGQAIYSNWFIEKLYEYHTLLKKRQELKKQKRRMLKRKNNLKPNNKPNTEKKNG